MKDMQSEQLLYYSGMTDTEHCKTSSSNEEDYTQRPNTKNTARPKLSQAGMKAMQLFALISLKRR